MGNRQKNISVEERKSFLGYAPVLEAIARHILSEKNRAKLISDLQNQSDCVSIIMKIMNDLLEREHEKVVAAFKQKCKDQHLDFSNWNNVYSSEEQLVRLVNYTLFKETEYTCLPIPDLPPQLIEDYQEILHTFLPQHPYIRNSSIEKIDTESGIDFAGPAFRDFTLAKLILTEDQFDSAHLYFEEMLSKHRSTSQIFFDCYTALAKGTLALSDIAYVFESFCAKATVTERPYLRFTANVDEDGTKEGTAVFEMERDNSTKSSRSSSKYNSAEFSTKFNIEKIVFSRLINVFIDAPELVVKIGSTAFDASVKNSSVICKQIEFCSSAITFESFGSDGCCLVSTDPILSESTRIEIYNDENLKVSAPNINEFFRLIRYSYRFDDASSIDDLKFAHAVRCIMVEFRTHRKDTLGKDAERVDNVVVGSNPIKKKVLNYLKARGVIYRQEHLYKVNLNEMQKININYLALTRMNTDQLKPAYHDFCSWEMSQ